MAMEESSKLHVLCLPYFTPSHMIPLVNAARVMAAQGVKITILTTKHNAAVVQSSIDEDNQLGRDISIHNLRFPAAEVGLPEGIENFPAATTMEIMGRLYQALPLLQKPMEDFIMDLRPHCIFSDMFFPWTVDLADKMKIPRLMFYVNSFMSHCLPHYLEKYEPHKQVSSDSESFLIPGFPDKVEMKGSQLEEHLKKESFFTGVIKVVKDSELRSHGLVFDNFYELEPQYADYYQKVIGSTKIWNIGPLFHFANKDKLITNNIVSSDKHSCLDWLDTQEPNSVVYVSFGSITRFSQAQINEIASALENSNRPFIWVVRKFDEANRQDSWLPDGFEERIRNSNKGLIFKGWAPQLKILQHPATGGFMTHCGWNSVLEALISGVPLITWPLFAEQFYNEILVGILKVGISLGSDQWQGIPVIKGVVLESSDIEKGIHRMLSDTEESRKVRERTKEMSEIAKKSVEVGGSSYQDLLGLIDDLKSCAFGVKN
ncbi:OLC1v1016823C1 [Oldenlandia corymbosa var. corymbosa]|uniref:Glycosyltransferase n=1 Tax=Oldenlandia corymbosa var. corymbosa TaxID=529605 RepID=A0AAV1E815_OLDCO|nr:OLC1v1016823C1 [Oldenlandia corymbosa var. corymbosa]